MEVVGTVIYCRNIPETQVATTLDGRGGAWGSYGGGVYVGTCSPAWPSFGGCRGLGPGAGTVGNNAHPGEGVGLTRYQFVESTYYNSNNPGIVEIG